jgi:hypothetical protein
MSVSMTRFMLPIAVLSLSLLQGCATSIKATALQNPAPAEALSAYGRIELRSAVFRSGLSGNGSGLVKIDENIKKDLAESLATWNKRPDNGRTLVIEPVVEELEFQHGAKRILLGPLAGSSGVLLRVTMRDAKGQVVAKPEFFQRADAMAAGFIFGVHDNLMLTRVANLASKYVIANFERPLGGPTGADDKAITAK